ncbi:helix-turn-helix domain-containing protein [Desulforhopalus singaporensis]|uniref:Transcriptional regulator, XRE family with cupin sensor n=1 Tax=Desulforhopalus singaporensis TaxID=91360 RepID=A0A1H0LD21_9BACT|nr:helix-turn-helix domain-containing protein [Desulforhopalus singaporensis]SDO65850.1 transcriptional regulator, XRE family with cupin sensor [Desulforhopalus singaporensis]
MNIGTLLRKYRKKQRLTLKVVAEQASISEGFLSQVENDVNSPSVETLIRICNALGIDAGELINEAGKKERIKLIRKSEWKEMELPHTGFATRRFFPQEDRKVLDSSVLVLEPGRSIPVRKNIKHGQEILSVLKGAVELKLSGQCYNLGQGDSAHFWANPDQQKITNTGNTTSFILWVGTM